MPPLSATSFRNKKLLVVDDERRLAESLAALLRGVGYDVRAAISGHQGLEEISQRSFDLIITDLRMDGVDGFDIMREIAENHPETALIVITGHATTESAIEALHQRVADYIPKPFDFDLLRGSIEKVFAQQDAERLRRDLVHMLSHDLKVPLTAVLGFAQLIAASQNEPHPEAPQYAEIIVLNCQRVIGMLDNFLMNTRAEQGKLEIAPIPFRLREAIEATYNLCQLEFKKRRVTVTMELLEPTFIMVADEPLVTRAISNLINNAAKYTPSDGWVRIESRNADGHVEIAVLNNGSTVKPEEAPQLFDRFRRGHTARGIEGTGLGLHIVRTVAEAHDGTATCSVDNDTIRFQMRLPMRTTLTPEI